ncbi:MAG: FAD-dependent oxidoreductase [Rhizobiales bacterium]|nr:FAD-dependent oxidoreductase [Hyphomicrobiales bacterium]
MKPLSIAVVGSGIAGLSAAWLLSKTHDVTVLEAQAHAGGHANTIEFEDSDARHPVDTGFIVYNPPNYPNLVALFNHLKVPTEPSRMTFAFSAGGGAYEYSGTRLSGLFGQVRNVANPDHWKMLFDLMRFFRNVERTAHDIPETMTLGELLRAGGYGRSFIENHLLPMASAIWSSPAQGMENYPAKSFVRFFANHGLLQARKRPAWRTVAGGSRQYVKRLIEDGDFRIELNCAVKSIKRRPGNVVIEDGNGVLRMFDHVVLATHADQALSLLEQPGTDETALLGKFAYCDNLAVVHTDARQMPRRRHLWSSWNYVSKLGGSDAPTISYWMNSLQNLPSHKDVFVTLNPSTPIAPLAEIARFNYTHPMYSASALHAQNVLWNLQGRARTWFCGSYFGAGFHEDALQSGLAVAEQLGGQKRPWRVENPSGRIVATRDIAQRGMAAE